MALKVFPEVWIAKYIKSATNGRTISVRLARVLTLVILPIWIYGFVQSAILTFDAAKAVGKYRKIQEFKKGEFYHNGDDLNPYGGHTHKDWYQQTGAIRETVRQGCRFDAGLWDELSEEHSAPAFHMDDVRILTISAENDQKGRMQGFFALPVLFVILVVIPWACLRMIFWIINAKD